MTSFLFLCLRGRLDRAHAFGMKRARVQYARCFLCSSRNPTNDLLVLLFASTTFLHPILVVVHGGFESCIKAWLTPSSRPISFLCHYVLPPHCQLVSLLHYRLSVFPTYILPPPPPPRSIQLFWGKREVVAGDRITSRSRQCLGRPICCLAGTSRKHNKAGRSTDTSFRRVVVHRVLSTPHVCSLTCGTYESGFTP